MEKDLKPNEDSFSKSFIYLEAQIKVQEEMEWAPNQPPNRENTASFLN